MARHIVCVLDQMVGHVSICWDYVSTFLCNKMQGFIDKSGGFFCCCFLGFLVFCGFFGGFFWRFIAKFKMAAKSGRKTIFASSRQ